MIEVTPTVLVLSSLNRKQMEEDRLARLAQRAGAVESRKRKASTSAPSLDNGQRQAKTSRNLQDLDTTTTREMKAAARGYTSEEATNRRSTASSSDTISSTQLLSGASSLAVEKERENNTPGRVAGSGIQFPSGTIKKTWAYGYPREDDIKIEEVLQSSTLELAVLSTFQIDADWIQSKLLPSTKVVWVLQAETEFEKANWQSSAPKTFRFCFPSMQGGIKCMHSKLQLLAHPTHLRIVIPSANLTPYDWGERGGIIENVIISPVVFLIDIPRTSGSKIASDNTLTPFARELIHFLKAMGLDSTIVESLRKFDFSNTNHLRLVHSMYAASLQHVTLAVIGLIQNSGGSHFDADMHRTGYSGLGNAVRDLGLDTEKLPEVDIITASIGNLNDQFIRSIYLAVQAAEITPEFNITTCPSHANGQGAGFQWTPFIRLRKIAQEVTMDQKSTSGEPKDPRSLRPIPWWRELQVRTKLVADYGSISQGEFPYRSQCQRHCLNSPHSEQTVIESKGGKRAAGTICFQSKWYDSTTFPKGLMRDCRSNRKGLLMHNKMLLVRAQKTVSGGECQRPIAWAYVGSANLSESACIHMVVVISHVSFSFYEGNTNFLNKHSTDAPYQGPFGHRQGEKATQIDLECGVLFSVPFAPQQSTPTRDMGPSIPAPDVFDGFVPVPIIFPSMMYDSKRPWFYNEEQ
ncbi:hypothetical protein CJF32_00005997 [Rutstroemia sp. NJR-2017a WRK4]|nr:hypothetical protein CJF32_00005997 [Rutstroemia sp. NJR-2017a WRK4]